MSGGYRRALGGVVLRISAHLRRLGDGGRRINRMKIRDRIADLLWRDRDGYDPTTGTVSDQRNVSALGWLRTKRHSAGRKLGKAAPWLIPTVVSTTTAVVVPVYLDRRAAEADKQVNANAWELRLQCAQQADGVLACRRVNADHKVIAGADGQGLRASNPGRSITAASGASRP